MNALTAWIDFRDGRLDRHEEVVHAMTDAMRDRGPHGKGVWVSTIAALGHRALATTPEMGEQPRVVDVGGVPIVVSLAGEIYNAAELARSIEDTGGRAAYDGAAELFAHAYLTWGERFVERVNGVFAFALWDGRERRLIFGRDRIGIKPLYYYPYPDGLLLASVPKGIMANPRFTARLDLAALPAALQPRLAMPGETPLEGLVEVPPGTVLTFSVRGLSERRYWQLTSAPHEESFEQTAQHVRGLLEDIVGRQLTDGAPLAAMLSGGVDSTSVAALAAARLRDGGSEALNTYCVQFESDAEHFAATELRPDIDAPFAEQAAAFLGTRHHTLTVGVQDLLDVIPATRRARDLPGWGQFDASMYLLFREISRHGTVAFTGEAADEFFGGYPYFFKPEVLGRDGFPWLGDGPKLSRYLAPELMAKLDPEADERARYAQVLAEVPRLPGESAAEARMREVLYLGMRGPLAVILDRKERLSASLGLDVRVPFCDYRLVEYVWNVPWALKCTGGVKGLLKTAMADLLPPSTVQRKKSAYPHVQNPAYDQALVRAATAFTDDRDSALADLFDRERLRGLIAQIAAGAVDAELPGGSNQAALLIQLVELKEWVEQYSVAVG